MSFDRARRGFLAEEGYWAAELAGLLDKERPGSAYEWVSACVSAMVCSAGAEREAEALRRAALCEEPDELRQLAGPFEGSPGEPLSLALANLLVARAVAQGGDLSWSRFFLCGAMRLLAIYCRRLDIAPETLFELLPFGPRSQPTDPSNLD
jgi:hypothetical protein